MRARGAVVTGLATTPRAASSFAPSLTIRRDRNSASSCGSFGRWTQAVCSLRSLVKTSVMPRWLRNTSLPPPLRSTRTRKRSRRPLSYRVSSTRPSVRRMMSCGILARFSAQSVSITPAWALSTSRLKPRSCQNDCSWGHSCSGRHRHRQPALIAFAHDAHLADAGRRHRGDGGGRGGGRGGRRAEGAGADHAAGSAAGSGCRAATASGRAALRGARSWSTGSCSRSCRPTGSR